MFGILVIIRARHNAKIRAKSLIVSEKTISIIAHLCSETAVFRQKSAPFQPSGYVDQFDSQEQSMLFYPT
jgi:hypothetical protein